MLVFLLCVCVCVLNWISAALLSVKRFFQKLFLNSCVRCYSFSYVRKIIQKLDREVGGVKQILPFLCAVLQKIFSFLSDSVRSRAALSIHHTCPQCSRHRHSDKRSPARERRLYREGKCTVSRSSCITREEESIGHLKHWCICVCVSQSVRVTRGCMCWWRDWMPHQWEDVSVTLEQVTGAGAQTGDILYLYYTHDQEEEGASVKNKCTLA